MQARFVKVDSSDFFLQEKDKYTYSTSFSNI